MFKLKCKKVYFHDIMSEHWMKHPFTLNKHNTRIMRNNTAPPSLRQLIVAELVQNLMVHVRAKSPPFDPFSRPFDYNTNWRTIG
jgi:hypothetical protein